MFLLHNDYWEIKKTKEKGVGVFVKKKLHAGIVIGDYLGKVIKIAEYDLAKDKDGLYLMYLTDHAAIYPDLKKPGIHLLNHSCQPNCWMYAFRGHTLFFALRDISPNEELTISYLLSPNENCAPCTHTCKCNSQYCTGTMHLSKEKYELWQRFQSEEMQKINRGRFVYGKNLPQLSSYPEIQFNNSIYAKMLST